MQKSGFVAAALLCGALMPSTDAQNTQRDVRFSKKLNELQLSDYSLYFIQKQIKGSPSDVDLLRIQLAETYLMSGKEPGTTKGTEIINSIAKDNQYYPFALMTMGKVSFIKRKYKEAIVALKAFEDYCKETYPEEGYLKAGATEAMEADKAAMIYLANAYKNSGQADLEKAAIEGFKLRATGPQDKTPSQVKYEEAVALIDSGAGNTSLTQAIKILEEELPFFGQTKFAAYSYYQVGRAYYLMGEFDKGIKALSLEGDAKSFVAEVNGKYGETDSSKFAPGGFMAYWKGMCLLKKAKQASGEDQIKLYKDAFIQFFVNLKKYSGNEYGSDAYDKYKETLAVLEENSAAPKKMPEFPVPIKIAKDSILGPKETVLFNEKKYAELIPKLQDLISIKRQEEGVTDALYKLSLSYLETGMNYEAIAVADYMALMHPKSNKARAALSQIGRKLWASEAKTDIELKEHKELAVREYSKFLDIAPGHPASPDIAALVSYSYYYKKATDLATAAKEISDQKKKREMTDEALAAFKSAVPFFKYTADNYGASPRGIDAMNMVASCYSSARQYEKAAEAYKVYVPKVLEEKAKLASAKFSVADSYFRAGQKFNKEYKALKKIAKEQARIGSEESKALSEAKSAESMVAKTKSEKNFKNAIEHLNDYLGAWQTDSKYLGVAKEKGVSKTTAGAYELIGWCYDYLDERQTAADKFGVFIEKYPASDKIAMLMERQGSLYAEMEDFKTASSILGVLAKKHPETVQGKRALFTLARSMYNIGKFDKAISRVNEIFEKKVDMSVSNLKWVVKYFVETDEANKRAAGKLIVRAGKKLEELLEEPVLADWIGADKAFVVEKNPEERQKMIDSLRERLYFNIGISAAAAGLTQDSINYLTDVLENEDTAYIVDAAFTRAEQYMVMKDYVNARKDLGKVAGVAMSAENTLISLKVQNKTGDTYLDEDNFKKAFSAYNIVALRPLVIDKELAGMMSQKAKNDVEASRPMVEYAIYKAAYCASKLAFADEVTKLVEKYNKNFANGRFVKQMANLPEPVVVKTPAPEAKTTKTTPKK